MRSGKLEIYKARDGWRWRFKAGNGKIIAESGEAYHSKWNAKRGFEKSSVLFVRWVMGA